MSDIEKAKEALNEAIYTICRLCKRLNPHHTGSPETCDCTDIEYLKKTLAALEEKPSEACSTFRCYIASSDCSGCCLRKDCFPNEGQVQAFAESYHARECAKCRELGGRA
jgi:hypothetical protein